MVTLHAGTHGLPPAAAPAAAAPRSLQSAAGVPAGVIQPVQRLSVTVRVVGELQQRQTPPRQPSTRSGQGQHRPHQPWQQYHQLPHKQQQVPAHSTHHQQRIISKVDRPRTSNTRSWQQTGRLQDCQDWHALAAWLSGQAFTKHQGQQHTAADSVQEQQPWWERLGVQECLHIVRQAVMIAKAAQQQRGKAVTRAAAPGAATAAPPVELRSLLLQLIASAAARLQPGDAVGAAELLRGFWRLSSYSKHNNCSSSSDHRAASNAAAATAFTRNDRGSGKEQSPDHAALGLTAQEQQVLGQQLLHCMSAPQAPHTPAAAARAAQHPHSISNANLFADVCQAVLQLQLQPDSRWSTWSYSTSLRLMQAYQQDLQQQQLLQEQRQQRGQRGQGQQQHWHQPSSKPTSWFLTVTLQLAAYLQQQQQQQPVTSAGQQEPPVGLPVGLSSTWLAAWAWAAAQLPQPFGTRQLLIVTHALRQLHLQQQLPDSFWQQHVAAAAVQQLQPQDLLQLLQQLPPQCQQWGSEPPLPSAWLQAAADALPSALAAVAGNIPQTRSSQGFAAGGVFLTVPLQLLQQGTAAVDGLVAAGWRGADLRWCQEMWRAVLGVPLEQGGVCLQQTGTVAQHRPSGMLTAVPSGADVVTAAAAQGGVGFHEHTSLNNNSSSNSSSRSARTASSSSTRSAGAAAAATSPKHWVCLGRALRGAALAASTQDADLLLQPEVEAAAAAIDGVTGIAAAAAAAVLGQAATNTNASTRWPAACGSQPSSWATALQNVLTTSRQLQQSAGHTQAAQPIAGQLGQQHTAQQPLLHHLVLPAAVAASLLVALVQLSKEFSSSAAEPAGPEATSTAPPAVRTDGSSSSSSSSSIRVCTSLLLQSLTGQLHQLGLQQLLSLGRALVAPLPWLTPTTQGVAASQPHGQQQQQQSGPDERQCLLLQAPQLVSEFVHQVAVWAPEATPDDLNTALSVVRVMLRATAHIHPPPAAAAAAAGAAALDQHQGQWEQEQLLLQEPLSQLLAASMQQLWEQQQQHQEQQQQQHHHMRRQQHKPRALQHDQQPAAVLQVQLLLNMLRLYTALADAGSVAVRPCMPGVWWQQWFEAARGPVLAAASLQELLALCRLLQQAKQQGMLSYASPATAGAAAADVAGDEGSVVLSRSLPATTATGEHDKQQTTQQLQAWLNSDWLPALTTRLESKEGLSLNVQAGIVRSVAATGIAPTASFLQAWGRSCAASVQHTLAAAAEAADTAAAAAAENAGCVGADDVAAAADAAAAVAAFKILGGCSCRLFAAAADAGWVYPAVWHTAAEQMALAVAATAHAAVTSHQSTQQQQQQQDHSGLKQQQQQQDHSGLKQQQQQQQQAWVQTAAQCVLQLARATQHQAPGSAWMAQLEQQLLPLLQFGNLQGVATVLWAFAAVWRVHPSGAFLQAVLADSQTLLQQSGGTYSSQLRVLLLSLAILRVQQLSRPWLQAVMQSTGQALIAASKPQRSIPVSSDTALAGATTDTLQQQQQQMSSQEAAQSPDFVADVAWSLAVLGVTPSTAWQQLWQQQVSRTLTHLSPDQVVDCLYAAAVWHTAAEQAAQATARAGVVPADRLPHSPGQMGAAAGQSAYNADSPGHVSSSGSSSSGTAANPSQQTSRIASGLLPRPQHWHAAAAARSSGSAGSMPGSFPQGRPLGTAARPAAAAAAAAAPPRPWLEALLQELRARFRQCSPKQLTVALWSLGQLGLKAPVDWLDALYDELLQQLPSCSLVQLCQLLQALLHQQHDLAPARVDAVLQAGLVRLQVATGLSTRPGKGPAVAVAVPGDAAAAAVATGGVSRAAARSAAAAVEARGTVEVPHAPVDLRLVVWMLQLVVKLKHEPQQQWCAGVATAVQQQLLLLHTQSGQGLQHSGSAAGPRTGPDSSSRSSRGGEGPHLAPEVFCELLQQMALLDFDLPGSWTATAEAALRPLLPHCSGEQLAVLLSATTRLHWFQSPAHAAARTGGSIDEVKLTCMGLRGSRLQSRQVFLTRLLRQLRRHLGSLDPRSLGLVGAAVSQLGLHMQEREWVQPFMAAVKVIAASHIPLSATEVADLQRSVQYLSWKRRTAPWCRSKSSNGSSRTVATLSSFSARNSWRCRQHRCRLARSRPRPTACGLQQLRLAAKHDTVRRLRSQVP